MNAETYGSYPLISCKPNSHSKQVSNVDLHRNIQLSNTA